MGLAKDSTEQHLTTQKQRKQLFRFWQITGDVERACDQANVAKSTFYYWKPRFDAGGYAALEDFASRAPRNPQRVSAEIEQLVCILRQQHPSWGKRRIAREVNTESGGEVSVSPNTVRRILQDAMLWELDEISTPV